MAVRSKAGAAAASGKVVEITIAGAADENQTPEVEMPATSQVVEITHLAAADASPALQCQASAAALPSVSFEKASSQFQQQLESKMKSAMKNAEVFTNFAKGNVEAAVSASTIWVNGTQDLTKLWTSRTEAAMASSAAALKALMAVKSVREAIDLQSSFAKEAFESTLADSRKLTEASMKLAEEAFAPLNARLNAAVETMTSGASA
jgi:phasin family protein